MPSDVVLVDNLSNLDFFAKFAAPGRVGLVGGPDFLEKAIRRAQRKQREDRTWSDYGHAFMLQGTRVDGWHWVIESDIDIHRERAQIGVQENRIDKYESGDAYPHVAILDFRVTSEQANKMLALGLDLLARRTQYSLREVLAAYLGLRKPDARSKTPRLAQDRAMFCSAFVQRLYLEVGIDFADDVDTKLTTPEDIAQTGVPHVAYVLRRPPVKPAKKPGLLRSRRA